MMVTMKDVVEKAGVSVTTVSHVINKTRFVSEEAKKILKKIAFLSHQANCRVCFRGMTTRDIVAAFKEMYDAKDMKQVAAGLKSIYNSPTLAGAEKALDDFSERWDEKYPAISKSWRSHWDKLITIFDYPNEIRRIIYTTNAIEFEGRFPV